MFKSIYQRLISIESDRSQKKSGIDITNPRGRRRAFVQLQLLDHGILREFWSNLYQISPGVWRSNQPAPRRLRKYKSMGIRTVLNLRGANLNSAYQFEKETCEAIGLGMVNLNLSGRRLVSSDVLLALLDTFETVPQPFVMHCKSGADRAGLASALYLLHMNNASIADAKKQLALKYMHVRSFQSGILDHMLDAYEADQATDPMPIRKWLETRYDPVKLTAEFDAIRGKS